jgi:hypothetical protein
MRYDLVGRSADRRFLVVRERASRRAGALVQSVFRYRAVPDEREDADPSAGEALGSTGDPGLREALARLLGDDGAAALLAGDADALLGRRR